MAQELTKEQEAVIESTAKEYMAMLNRGDELDPTSPGVVNGLALIYRLYDSTVPEVVVYDSPQAALDDAKKNDVQNPRFDLCGVYDADWIAHYDAFLRIGVLKEDEEKDFIAYREFLKAGVYDTILCKERAFIVRFPQFVKLDDQNRLHCADGPAIRWRDGFEKYVWHGVNVPEKTIMAPETYTATEIKAITNTEHRRVLAERLGWNRFLELLGSKVEDTWTDSVTSLSYELLSASGQTERFIKKQSPPLKDGSQPFYCEPVHPELKTAQAARKWQAVVSFGGDPGTIARECNRHPELRYEWEA